MKEGYAFIYLSNENPTMVDVYFDDVSVTYTPSNIIQSTDYYPFGHQTDASWTRTDVQANQYLYNAGSELNSTTGSYEMFFREYDPLIGRMNAIDPMAGKYSSLTPYNYALNGPVNFSDPSGADPDPDPVYYDDVPQRTINGYGDLLDYGPMRTPAPWYSIHENTYAGQWAMGMGSPTYYSNLFANQMHSLWAAQAEERDLKERAKAGDPTATYEYAQRHGSSYGEGLGAVTAAVFSLNAVKIDAYGAGTFTYSFGGLTYGGTYHTTNGKVTSTATGLVVRSGDGGWSQRSNLEIYVIDETSMTSSKVNNGQDEITGYGWDNFLREIVGGGLVASGQPWLKKRFVTKATTTSRAASRGTSLASKYLSRLLPQKLPVRIMGTTVLGRSLGRMVPYAGWALLIWDAADILYNEIDSFVNDTPEEYWRKARQNVTSIGMYQNQ